jgi:hypothetical protein
MADAARGRPRRSQPPRTSDDHRDLFAENARERPASASLAPGWPFRADVGKMMAGTDSPPPDSASILTGSQRDSRTTNLCNEDMNGPPLLNPEMLQAYEERLRTIGVPINDWTPGLTDEQMRETLAPLGLRLPAEGRTWWGWHDGSPGYGDSKLIAPPGERFLTLAEAVETYREYRKIVEELVEPDIPELANPDDRWSPSWLPIRGPQLPVVIDCSVGEGPTPLRRIDLQDVEDSPRPRAQSLGQMVTWWIAALDSGAWRWDAERAEWSVNRELLEDGSRNNPLA